MEGEHVKVYCCDRGNDNNALTAAILANRDRDDNNAWPMMAMMNNGMNGFNNPLAWFMMMAWMRNGFGGWDGNGGPQGIEIQNQLESMRNQLNDNQNVQLLNTAIGNGFQRNDFALSQLAQNLNVDFNALQKCCCDVQAAIQGVAGQVGLTGERVINASILGDKDILAKMCECCCGTQRQIADFRGDMQLQMCQQTNTLQRGQDFINRSVERGFAAQGFQAQQDKCDILAAGQANTQRIIDTLNNHWNQEQLLENQRLRAELDNRDQTDAIIARLNGGCGCQTRRSCGCGNNSRYGGF